MKVIPYRFLSGIEEACLLRWILLHDFGAHDPRRLFESGVLVELDDRQIVVTPKGEAYFHAYLESVDVPIPGQEFEGRSLPI